MLLRAAACGIAAALALAASPVVAHEGWLPVLGQFAVGPYSATLYNDSPGLVVGRNTVTVELASAQPQRVTLSFTDDRRAPIGVPLRSVRVLGDEAPAPHTAQHGAPEPAGHAHGASAEPAHGTPARPASEAPREGHGAHGGSAAHANRLLLRGPLQLPDRGRWRAELVVVDAEGSLHRAETTLDVTSAAPHRLYLSTLAALVAASVLVGAVHRVRRR